MPTLSEIQVLRRLRPLTRILAVHDADIFGGNNDQRAKVRNALRVAAYAAALLTQLLTALFYSLTYWLLEMGWRERAFHLALILSLIQQCSILIATARKNREIFNAFDQLQRIVDNRKSFHFISLSSPGQNAARKRPKCSFIHFYASLHFTGSIQSPAIYEQVEQRWSSIFEKVAKAFAASVVIMYALPMLQPLSYVVFGHPKPSEWTISHGAG